MPFLQMLTFYIIKSSTTNEDQKINTILLCKRQILVTFLRLSHCCVLSGPGSRAAFGCPDSLSPLTWRSSKVSLWISRHLMKNMEQLCGRMDLHQGLFPNDLVQILQFLSEYQIIDFSFISVDHIRRCMMLILSPY